MNTEHENSAVGPSELSAGLGKQLNRLTRQVKRWLFLYIWCRYFYRHVMRLAHRYNWHYAPPIYPEGDTQLWCQWCGFRMTIKHSDDMTIVVPNVTNQRPRNAVRCI